MLGHFALYALLFALPLTGWALISTSGKPSLLFGYMDIPLIPWLSELAADTKKSYHEIFEGAHGVIAYVLLFFIAAHLAAALRHAILLKDGVFLQNAAPLWPGSRAVICRAAHETLRKRPRNSKRARPLGVASPDHPPPPFNAGSLSVRAGALREEC